MLLLIVAIPEPLSSSRARRWRWLCLQVFQGIQGAASSVDDKGELIRLWTHEILRVFHDRLVDDADREWLVSTVGQRTELHFKEKFSVLMGRVAAGEATITGKQLRNLVFCDFMIPGADPQVYDEVTSMEDLFA